MFAARAQVMDILFKCYNEEPYPTEELLTDIVKRVNAPGVAQVYKPHTDYNI
jgi:hypothetical protein